MRVIAWNRLMTGRLATRANNSMGTTKIALPFTTPHASIPPDARVCCCRLLTSSRATPVKYQSGLGMWSGI